MTYYFKNYPALGYGAVLLTLICIVAMMPSFLGATDPLFFNPRERFAPPSASHWFGTDNLGRDVYSRTLYGGRISLLVGISVCVLATTIGLIIGLASGFNRTLDSIVMRVMDGIMAIPSILLAIALIAIFRASVVNVIIAVTIAEIPRVVRLVRGLVLTLRERPYVEAARSVGASSPHILFRHILPNALPPLTVQATYVCATAILIESALSFLGVGTPTETPTWGNIMAEGRTVFLLNPWIIFFPGLFLAVTVFAVNLLGDGLRDMVDPKLRARQ